MNSRAKIDAAISEMASRQCRRFVAFLGNREGVASGELASATATANLSDCAARARPYLERHGLTIVCERPPRPLKNRFGEDSHQHIWRIRELSEL